MFVPASPFDPVGVFFMMILVKFSEIDSGQSARHCPKPVRRCWRHDDRVGRLGDDDVTDAAIGQERQHIAFRRVPGQRLERQRRDESSRARRQQGNHVSALGLQKADQLGRLVGGD